jgi:asparaginyl-tRNA synthetase
LYNSPFERITYTAAVELYNSHNPNTQIEWGDDLSSEVEKYICEKIYDNATIIYNYPSAIKAFYMKENDDGKTVQAFDILMPGIGEIVGGSIREERYDVLKSKLEANNISVESLQWYLDLRKFGTCPHGGFGVGFERLIMLLTGTTNIRDVIPFPRYPNHCVC